MQTPLLSRRRMLAASTAGAAASCWSYRVPAADDVDPLSFVIVSDTHLGRNNNESAERNWRKAVGEINKRPGAFVIHLGDVVDSGREAQYPIIKALW